MDCHQCNFRIQGPGRCRRAGSKLLAEAAVAGLTLADMDLDEDTVEDYIRDIIVHVGEPGAPSD